MSAAGNAAERRGNDLAYEAFGQMLNESSNQAERLQILQAALMEAAEGPYPSRAIAGFAAALIPTLERGLAIGN